VGSWWRATEGLSAQAMLVTVHNMNAVHQKAARGGLTSRFEARPVPRRIAAAPAPTRKVKVVPLLAELNTVTLSKGTRNPKTPSAICTGQNRATMNAPIAARYIHCAWATTRPIITATAPMPSSKVEDSPGLSRVEKRFRAVLAIVVLLSQLRTRNAVRQIIPRSDRKLACRA
jgi:hypothetical protein